MEGDFIKKLSWDAKEWLAQAIAGVIVADGSVTPDEVEFLREAIRYLIEPENIEEYTEQVKSRQVPALQSLRVDRETAFAMIMHLAAISITDGKLSRTEVEFIKQAGGKLGFPKEFCIEVANWAHLCTEVEKQRIKLRNIALKTTSTI